MSTTIINGSSGFYNDYVKNQNVAQARNAQIDLASKTLEARQAGELEDFDFEMTYGKTDENGLVDTDAALGAAFEEMMLTDDALYDKETGEIYFDVNNCSIEDIDCIDLNGDNIVTLDEYAANIIYTDSLDSEDGTADGVITTAGQDALLMSVGNDKEAAKAAMQDIYTTYDFADAKDEFYSEESNTFNFLADEQNILSEMGADSSEMINYLLSQEQYLGSDEWGGSNEHETDGVIDMDEATNFLNKITKGIEYDSNTSTIEDAYNNWIAQNKSVGLDINVSLDSFTAFTLEYVQQNGYLNDAA